MKCRACEERRRRRQQQARDGKTKNRYGSGANGLCRHGVPLSEVCDRCAELLEYHATIPLGGVDSHGNACEYPHVRGVGPVVDFDAS